MHHYVLFSSVMQPENLCLYLIIIINTQGSDHPSGMDLSL